MKGGLGFALSSKWNQNYIKNSSTVFPFNYVRARGV